MAEGKSVWAAIQARLVVHQVKRHGTVAPLSVVRALAVLQGPEGGSDSSQRNTLSVSQRSASIKESAAIDNGARSRPNEEPESTICLVLVRERPSHLR